MNTDNLKKILAGLCIAGLVSGTTISVSGCTAKSACSGSNPKADSAKSGCGASSCSGTQSGCSGASSCSGDKTDKHPKSGCS
ncbi:MAG: SbtA family thio(seleno)oxazole RiPP natural product precursor [Desulfobacterales bacterium]|nr:SbtA family thio(seleno)oxazole RiPP natural product precursor [Desulfobacterales bacterium]